MVDLGEGADLVHKPWNHSVEMEPVVESTLRYRKQAPTVQEEMISSAGAILSSRSRRHGQMYSRWRTCRCIQHGGRMALVHMGVSVCAQQIRASRSAVAADLA